MHLEQCVFWEGNHYGPPDCVHLMPPEEDELGPIIPVGWTVQQG